MVGGSFLISPVRLIWTVIQKKVPGLPLPCRQSGHVQHTLSDIDRQLKSGHDSEKQALIRAVEEYLKADSYSVSSLLPLPDGGYDKDHIAYSNRGNTIGPIAIDK
jgi:hypothetical protein